MNLDRTSESELQGPREERIVGPGSNFGVMNGRMLGKGKEEVEIGMSFPP